MSSLESIFVAGFMMAVVFFVLFSLYGCIRIFSFVVQKMEALVLKKKSVSK